MRAKLNKLDIKLSRNESLIHRTTILTKNIIGHSKNFAIKKINMMSLMTYDALLARKQKQFTQNTRQCADAIRFC